MMPTPNTVMISITGGHDANVHFKGDDILRLRFDDVEKDIQSYKTITYIQARELANYLTENRGKNFIVHCAAGISRSGAVCEVVLQAFPEYEDHGDPRLRWPNPTVVSLLKRELGLVPIGAENGEGL